MFLGGWTLGKLAYFTTCQQGKYLGNINNNRGSIRRLDHLKKMWMSELLLHTFLMLLLFYNILWVHTLGWTKMHEVFKSLLPRYFLKDIYVKWSQFEFQTIWSNFHYTPRRLKFLLTIIVLAKFRLKMIFEFFLIKVSQKL